MKVNKKILTVLMMGGMLFSVGCSKVNNSNETNISTNTTVETEVKDSNSRHSKEELISKYEELLPEIKQIYDSYGLPYRDYKEEMLELKKEFEAKPLDEQELLKNAGINFEVVNLEGVDGIALNKNPDTETDINNAYFNVYYEHGDENSIYFSSMSRINVLNSTEEGKFDIKGTFLEDITEAINNKNNSVKIDYEKINDDINEMFENNVLNSEKTYNYGNLEILTVIYGNHTIGYSVKIK